MREDVIECIGATELAKRQFREIARIAGLVFDAYPGRDKSLRKLQASAGLIYDVLTHYDPHHILLRQALDEVCERMFNFARLQATLEEMKTRNLILQRPAALTPFGSRYGANGSAAACRAKTGKPAFSGLLNSSRNRLHESDRHPDRRPADADRCASSPVLIG